MALPDRDAERLDHALDAQLRGREESQNDSFAGLLTTLGRLQAMNERVETDSTLRSELWRSMMSTIALTRPVSAPGANRLPVGGSRTIRFSVKAKRRGPLLQTTLAIALLLALVLGTRGYRQYGSGNDGPNIPAPMAAQLGYQGPNVAECKVQPRDPGTVEDLAGQQPVEPAVFPRYGDEPTSLANAPEPTLEAVETSALLAQTEPITSTDPTIYEFLDQLLNCSPYLLASPSDIDLDGRYFALFSDDFFRREFAGYEEAGRPIEPTRVWTLHGSKPNILDVRLLGDRIVLILDTPSYRKSLGYTALLLTKEEGSWLIDEIGDVGTAKWHGTVDRESSSPVARLNSHGPLEAGYVLLPCHSKSSETSDRFCGEYSAQIGPWLYNEYLANVDFTFSISNTSSADKRFEINTLGVSVIVGRAETVPIMLNAAPGSYDFQVFDSGSGRLLTSGTLKFKTADEGFGMG